MRVSRRDLSLLRVVGEDGGARLSLLRQLLAIHGAQADGGWRTEGVRTEGAARHWADRMVRAGYLRNTRILGGPWFTLTPAGARLVDLLDAEGNASPRVVEAALVVEHTSVVSRLRLHLQAAEPDAEWVPERTFWQRQRQQRAVKFRRPDGALRFADRTVGVEVELHRKDADDYRPIVGMSHPDLAEVWWYCPPTMVAWLQRTLDQARGQLATESIFGGRKVAPCAVKALPEGVWP